MKTQYESPLIEFLFVFGDDVIRTSGVDGAKDIGVNGSDMDGWWNSNNK